MMTKKVRKAVKVQSAAKAAGSGQTNNENNCRAAGPENGQTDDAWRRNAAA
jgi:hypothetical protein